MSSTPRYRMPTPGKWHLTLDDIDPDARPNRPAEPPPGTPGRPRRQQAVARRSRQRVGPGGTYFYWCEHCGYCNTPEEGQTARCPEHRKAQAAARKAQWRDSTGGRHDAADHLVPADLVVLLWRRASALDKARRDHEIALRLGKGSAQKRSLDEAIQGLLDAVQRLPRPGSRSSSR